MSRKFLVALLALASAMAIGIFVKYAFFSKLELVHLVLPLQEKQAQAFKAGLLAGLNGQDIDLRIHDSRVDEDRPLKFGADSSQLVYLQWEEEPSSTIANHSFQESMVVKKDELGQWTISESGLLTLDKSVVDKLISGLATESVTIVRERKKPSVVDPLLRRADDSKKLQRLTPRQFGYFLKSKKDDLANLVILDIDKEVLNPVLDQIRLSGRSFRVVILDPFGTLSQAEDLKLFKGVSIQRIYNKVESPTLKTVEEKNENRISPSYMSGFIIGDKISKIAK